MSLSRPVRASVLLALCLSFSATPQAALGAERQHPERRALRARDTAPEVTLDAAAEASRLAAIDRAKELLAGGDLSRSQQADLLFRLAELTYEQGRVVQLRELAGITAAIDACYDAGGDCEAVAARRPVEGLAWQEESIALYRRILADHPDYARADEVTWLHGRTLIDAERGEEANAELTRLVRTWPDSTFATDAYVLIGEYWFERQQAPRAMAAYRRAAAVEAHEKHSFAVYKLAWCAYNLGEMSEALALLEQVIAGPADKAGRIGLRDEALADYVRFFADSGETDLRARLARHVAPDVLGTMEERLAEAWLAQGKGEQAIRLFRERTAAAPDDVAAPRWADGIVRALLKAGKLAEALDEVERMDARYGPRSRWAIANAAHADAVADVSAKVEAHLRVIATSAHTGSKAVPAQLPIAERAYALSLSRFPDGEHAYTLRYGYAELLYRLKKYDAAYAQYVAVVDMDPKGQHARFCAESAIFAAQQLAKAEATPVSGTAPVPLGAWETRQIDAIDRYVALFGGPKTLEMTYQTAWILYQKNHFREASERFDVVIASEPRSRQAEQAANLMLDSFALVEDWEALAAAADLYSRQANLGSEAFRREARRIHENARFKQVEARFSADGDKAAAAAGWRAYAEAFPTSANADAALHNAGVYLSDIGDVRGAIAVRQVLVADYPKSRHRAAAVAGLGFGYESLARFDLAAQWYERLATIDAAHPDAADALYSAGLFRASLGEWQAAVADWQRYVSAWPDRANAPGVTLEIGKLLAANGRPAEAAAIFKRVFDAPPAGATADEVMFARLRYGELLAEGGHTARATKHWNESLTWYRNAESVGEVGDGARASAAQMRFLLAEPQYRAFLALTIAGPAPQAAGGPALTPAQTDALLQEQLLAKVGAMRELEATYAAILEPGAGRWGLAALARIGTAYENLGATLEASYVPAYLTEEQRWLYEQRLRDLAYAQNERAAETYRTTLRKAFDLNVYDARTAEVARRLGALRPEEGLGLAEHVPAARFTTPASFVGGPEE